MTPPRLLITLGRVLLIAIQIAMLVNPGFGLEGSGSAYAQGGAGSNIPGFGGATAPPRMLVIFDTSRSMRFTPDNSAEFPGQDYEPGGGGTQTEVLEEEEEGDPLQLQCPSGDSIVSVNWAYYGRESENAVDKNLSNFNASNPADHDTPTDNNTGCGTGSAQQGGVNRGWIDVKSDIERECLGKGTCTFPVQNSSFTAGDPCITAGKQIAVSVQCGTDACPPGGGSKFCLGKRAVYNVVNSTDSLLEYAAAGYYQQLWRKYVPPVNASFATDCRYDVLRATAEGARSNTFSYFTNYAMTEPPNPNGTPFDGNPNTSVNFDCRPETMPRTANNDLAYRCVTGPSRPCSMSWAWTQSEAFVSENGTQNGAAVTAASERVRRWTHPAGAPCSTTVPTLASGSWTVAGTGCGFSNLTAPDRQFSHGGSGWQNENVLVSAAGTCEASFTNMVTGSTFRGFTVPPGAGCEVGNACTYFLRDPNAFQTTFANFYRDYGSASVGSPRTINGTNYTARGMPQTEGPITRTQTQWGGSCPATISGFGDNAVWGGCSATNPCDLTRTAGPNNAYSCPAGGSLNGTNCNVSGARAPGLTGNGFSTAGVGAFPGSPWRSQDFPLTTYAANGNLCPFESAGTTGPGVLVTSTTHSDGMAFSTPGCGSSNDPSSGTHQCRIRFHSKQVRTDLGIVTCSVSRWSENYTKPAVNTPTCAYSRLRYTYSYNEPRCQYDRFRYQYERKEYRYRFARIDGDLRPDTLLRNPSYPPTAVNTDRYCHPSNSPAIQSSYSNATGFTVPTGSATCKAELAPGEEGCPSNALRCKLRWGSTGNARFSQMLNVAERTRLFSEGVPRLCPAGDPGPGNGPTGGMASVWGDWCSTNNNSGFQPERWENPILVGDYYTLNAANGNNAPASRGSWLPVWNAGNPFNHSSVANRAKDKFSWFDLGDNERYGTSPSNGCSSCATPPCECGSTRASKDLGLSIAVEGPTAAPQYKGVSAALWGVGGVDAKRLFRKYDAATNPHGLRMPEQGDMTPLTGALANAREYIRYARTQDGLASCRRYSVLLITDGFEEPDSALTGTDPVGAVTALRNDNVDVYVVGFGIKGGVLDAMANAAGTAVNGAAYDASDYAGLIKALDDVIGQQLKGFYTRSSPTLTNDGRRVYSGYFEKRGNSPEFRGFLDAFPLASGSLQSTPIWRFHDRLDNQTGSPPRKMYVREPGNDDLMDFDEIDDCSGGKKQNLTFAMEGSCSTANRDAANRTIYFVRNDRSGSKAGRFTGTGSPLRESRVADIYHSQPAVLPPPFFSSIWASSPPSAQFAGMGDDGSTNFDGPRFFASYSAFKNKTNYQNSRVTSPINLTNRETTVFVSTNDGVLHAIRENPANTVTNQNPWGDERWAYVPRQILGQLKEVRDGHRWMNDGSFALTDVCFSKGDCEKSDGTGWVSLLIGAGGRAGNWLYGLDVTDPNQPHWLFDVNPLPNSPTIGLGQTWSAPTIARVNVDNEAYAWAGFMGGGWSLEGDNCAAGGIDTKGQDFIALDLEPSKKVNRSIGVMKDSSGRAEWCIPGVNVVDVGGGTLVTPKNNIPARVRVERPNDTSRARIVYFGDTDGKLMRSDVRSKAVSDWQPQVMFNPFSSAIPSSCIDNSIKPAPDLTGSDRSLPLAVPTEQQGLPSFWTRPILSTTQLANGGTMLYIGTGNSNDPGRQGTRDYFWAIEDNKLATGSPPCETRVAWSVYFGNSEKVLSEGVVLGENVIVPVYVPPSSTSQTCGAAGYTKLYCFNRFNGTPNFCLTDTTNAPIDSAAVTSGGVTRARYIRGGDGISSNLTAFNNTFISTTSVTPGQPQQYTVGNVAVPFRVRTWRRVR
jgi:hypothetical protein